MIRLHRQKHSLRGWTGGGPESGRPGKGTDHTPEGKDEAEPVRVLGTPKGEDLWVIGKEKGQHRETIRLGPASGLPRPSGETKKKEKLNGHERLMCISEL